jgi:hypothetical protein
VSEARFQAEDPGIEPVERAYDRNWALTVMDNSLYRLREEAHANGNTRIFEHLSPLLSREPAPGEYAPPLPPTGRTRTSCTVVRSRTVWPFWRRVVPGVD